MDHFYLLQTESEESDSSEFISVKVQLLGYLPGYQKYGG